MCVREADLPLHKTHATLLAEDKVAPEGVDYHEDQFVERRWGWILPPFAQDSVPAQFFITRQSWHEWLVWEEATREDQDRNGDEEVRKHKGNAPACHVVPSISSTTQAIV